MKNGGRAGARTLDPLIKSQATKHKNPFVLSKNQIINPFCLVIVWQKSFFPHLDPLELAPVINSLSCEAQHDERTENSGRT